MRSLKLFATDIAPVFWFVICSLAVVDQLFCNGSTDIEPEPASHIEDANDGICQLHLQHGEVRQLVVHQQLSVALHCFTHFAVNKA